MNGSFSVASWIPVKSVVKAQTAAPPAGIVISVVHLEVLKSSCTNSNQDNWGG